MSVLEQPALPFYENTELSGARFPWMTLDEAADRTHLNTDQSLAEMKQSILQPLGPHEISMDTLTADRAFAQQVLAFVKRCDEISYGHIDDSEKYYTVRHTMALRVVGLYFDTQHYFDARTELSYLKRELKITPDDPLIPYVDSAYKSIGMIPFRDSEPPKKISYMQHDLFEQ